MELSRSGRLNAVAEFKWNAVKVLLFLLAANFCYQILRDNNERSCCKNVRNQQTIEHFYANNDCIMYQENPK